MKNTSLKVKVLTKLLEKATGAKVLLEEREGKVKPEFLKIFNQGVFNLQNQKEFKENPYNKEDKRYFYWAKGWISEYKKTYYVGPKIFRKNINQFEEPPMYNPNNDYSIRGRQLSKNIVLGHTGHKGPKI